MQSTGRHGEDYPSRSSRFSGSRRTARRAPDGRFFSADDRHDEQQEASISALSKAKARYAERGDVDSCGDWLALALKDAFRTEDGSFYLTAFKGCLKENEIEAPKVDMKRHGSIGRFRMCAGLMLRRQAAKVGYVVICGKKIAAPSAKKRGWKGKATAANGDCTVCAKS